MGLKKEREKMERLIQTLENVEDGRSELLDALRRQYTANPTPDIFLQCVEELDVADRERVQREICAHSKVNKAILSHFSPKFIPKRFSKQPAKSTRSSQATVPESSSKLRIHFTSKHKPTTPLEREWEQVDCDTEEEQRNTNPRERNHPSELSKNQNCPGADPEILAMGYWGVGIGYQTEGSRMLRFPRKTDEDLGNISTVGKWSLAIPSPITESRFQMGKMRQTNGSATDTRLHLAGAQMGIIKSISHIDAVVLAERQMTIKQKQRARTAERERDIIQKYRLGGEYGCKEQQFEVHLLPPPNACKSWYKRPRDFYCSNSHIPDLRYRCLQLFFLLLPGR
ncbi:hypothetical protein ARMSODRAFT_976214 [Armillaria solidipes]|uniref:Uncharacterized protein n=1 Tax=Armillaria solidipes TaxID=1076256 RepID=A0A2H3BAP6_9AGAR|nr:hypothetical protein ARMSODRAFT_976214 [Armillaria solidipes]